MSQAELAAEAGIAKKSQTNYELGHSSPSADYLAAASGAGVDVLYVLTGVASPRLQGGEDELLRRFRACSPELQAAALAVVGVGVTFAGGGESSRVAISGGEQGQVIAGELTQRDVTFNVGGKKRGGRK